MRKLKSRIRPEIIYEIDSMKESISRADGASRFQLADQFVPHPKHNPIAFRAREAYHSRNGGPR